MGIIPPKCKYWKKPPSNKIYYTDCDGQTIKFKNEFDLKAHRALNNDNSPIVIPKDESDEVGKKAKIKVLQLQNEGLQEQINNIKDGIIEAINKANFRNPLKPATFSKSNSEWRSLWKSRVKTWSFSNFLAENGEFAFKQIDKKFPELTIGGDLEWALKKGKQYEFKIQKNKSKINSLK